jgi:chemotaxis protein methyltransferase CheR
MTFERFRALIHSHSGIALAPAKRSLLESRIAKRLRELELPEAQAYLARVENDGSGEELVQLLDAVSTNVTSFYREPDHYPLMVEQLKGLLAKGQRQFAIWSAASATGEEPFTLAMVLAEAGILASAQVRILATDISTRALAHGKAATYRAERLGAVPAKQRDRWFIANQDGSYTVRDELRCLITFARLNLNVPPYPMKGPFDVVFCRNVMIYFDNRTRAGLLGEITRLLSPGGLLMVGHSESLTGQSTGLLHSLRPSVYRKG